MLCMITLKGVLTLLIYCRYLIQLASNANDGLWMLLHLFSTPADQMPRRYCKIIESMSDFECTYSIGKALVLPAVTRRYENSNGLQIKIINNMRRFLGIKKVLGRPEPDNFIVHWKMFQMCGVYCRNSTLQEKKDEEQAEDEVIEVSEVYLQAAPSRGSIRLYRLRKVKHF